MKVDQKNITILFTLSACLPHPSNIATIDILSLDQYIEKHLEKCFPSSFKMPRVALEHFIITYYRHALCCIYLLRYLSISPSSLFF
jgi:hypothetical protein